MQNSRFVSLFPGLLIACAGFLACGGDKTETVSVAPGAGGGGGQAVNPAGTGGTGSTGTAGSSMMMGSGGSTGTAGDAVGAGVGGAAGGGTGGSAGGAGGAAGAGGASVDAGMNLAGKIVLFDGTNLDSWKSVRTGGAIGWTLEADKSLLVVPGTGDIITKMTWQDLFVHAEYKTPMLPANVTGQERGNSGLYLRGMYEMQVLDTFGHQPEIDGCGSVYGVKAPLVVACFKEEVWNAYDIEFKAPTYNAQGMKTANARITSAKLNDMVVQVDTEVPGTTRAGLPEAAGPAGIMLQDHSNRVWFRNIWVIPR